MARKFANVARSEIPSCKFVRLSSTFLLAFATKFLGSNPKIVLLIKAEGLEFFAY